MYNKKYLGIVAVLLGMGLMIAFTMFWGCSSDSTGPMIVQGNLTDPTFTAVRDNIDNAVDSLIDNLHTPLTNPWGLPLDSSDWTDPQDNIFWGPLNPGDSTDYGYSNDGWHTMYVMHLSASGSQMTYDSVAFYVNGHPWESFVTGVNEVKYRGAHESENEENDQTTTIHLGARVDYDNVDALIAVTGGTSTITYIEEYSEENSDITRQFDYAFSFDNLQLTRTDETSWDEITGLDGEIEAAMTYNMETVTGTDTDTVDQDWTIDVTLEGDVATVNATYGKTRWTYEHSF